MKKVGIHDFYCCGNFSIFQSVQHGIADHIWCVVVRFDEMHWGTS